MAKGKRIVKTRSGRTTVKAAKVLRKKSADNTAEAFDFTLNTIADYIKTRAYYIWEDLGKPEGKDIDIWSKAEKEILAQLIKK